LPPAERGARAALPDRGKGGADGRAEGPPERRWAAREHVQRGRALVGRGSRLDHAGLRPPPRLVEPRMSLRALTIVPRSELSIDSSSIARATAPRPLPRPSLRRSSGPRSRPRE